jgi:hypothetical protein
MREILYGRKEDRLLLVKTQRRTILVLLTLFEDNLFETIKRFTFEEEKGVGVVDKIVVFKNFSKSRNFSTFRKELRKKRSFFFLKNIICNVFT